MTASEWINGKEATMLIGCRYTHLKGLVVRGVIKVLLKPGRAPQYHRADVEAYAASEENLASASPQSNEEVIMSNNRVNNAWLPLTPIARDVVKPPNEGGGHFCGSSADLTRQPSPVNVPSHHFDVDRAKMAQPQSAIEPGKGAVPIRPGRAAAGLPLAYLRNAKDWK
jgi:hypothetical protein